MNINKTYIKLLCLVFVLPLLLHSCYEDNTCDQNTETGVNIEVTNSGSDSSTDLDSIDQTATVYWQIVPLTNDTLVLVSSDDESTSTGIPLDIEAETFTFLFQARDSDTTKLFSDTIVIEYIYTDLEALSIYCGYAPVFEIVGGTHTTNVLDSIALNERVVNTDLNLNNATFYY